MADEADRAQKLEEAEREASVKAASRDLAKGEPGECIECGDYFERLIECRCGECRDQRERDAELRRQRALSREG